MDRNLDNEIFYKRKIPRFEEIFNYIILWRVIFLINFNYRYYGVCDG